MVASRSRRTVRQSAKAKEMEERSEDESEASDELSADESSDSDCARQLDTIRTLDGSTFALGCSTDDRISCNGAVATLAVYRLRNTGHVRDIQSGVKCAFEVISMHLQLAIRNDEESGELLGSYQPPGWCRSGGQDGIHTKIFRHSQPWSDSRAFYISCDEQVRSSMCCVSGLTVCGNNIAAFWSFLRASEFRMVEVTPSDWRDVPRKRCCSGGYSSWWRDGSGFD
ncbi:hypothetical protein B0H14DRAFT_3132307 [Mycena olivaceomarginata]|nr:hypothetical protein B0H14DRAFT_3132307 [Mycena olivaceomarginata]